MGDDCFAWLFTHYTVLYTNVGRPASHEVMVNNFSVFIPGHD